MLVASPYPFSELFTRKIRWSEAMMEETRGSDALKWTAPKSALYGRPRFTIKSGVCHGRLGSFFMKSSLMVAFPIA